MLAGSGAVVALRGIAGNTGFGRSGCLSFSHTFISSVPSTPGPSQFSGFRHPGRSSGHPVPQTLSQEHSTRVLLWVLRRIALIVGFWSNFANSPFMHSVSA